MGRPTSNVIINDFEARLEWCVENLDTNPELARFCTRVNDIWDTFDDAVRLKQFAPDRSSRLNIRTWQNTKKGSVTPVFIDWITELFPDMTREHLSVSDIGTFYEIGRPIELARRRWRGALDYLARSRFEIEHFAKRYHSLIDSSQSSSFEYSAKQLDGQAFPLITQDGWIRRRPIRLDSTSEQPYLTVPDRGVPFVAPRLDGLSGDYVSYKGSLVYKNRRRIKAEPQHNGQIYCADSVLQDEGFVGFRYYLAHYFDYINTCEILGAELADWILSNETKELPETLGLRGVPQNALDFRARATYPGVNCLAIFRNWSATNQPSGDYYLVHLRDETQLQAQNTVHVAPAGGHQSLSRTSTLADSAIYRTVVREFLEEIFDREELFEQIDDWADIESIPAIQHLLNIFFTGSRPAANIFLHGFGLDPVTLKPEVLLTLVVDWKLVRQKWPKLRPRYNWEFRSAGSKKNRAMLLPLSKADLFLEAQGGRRSNPNGPHLKTLPAGAACMQLSAIHLDEILG